MILSELLDQHDLQLLQTCYACPEQYDLFDEDGECIGYFRLRGGFYSVSLRGPGGPVVHATRFPDMWKGSFDDAERDQCLTDGVEAVLEATSN